MSSTSARVATSTFQPRVTAWNRSECAESEWRKPVENTIASGSIALDGDLARQALEELYRLLDREAAQPRVEQRAGGRRVGVMVRQRDRDFVRPGRADDARKHGRGAQSRRETGRRPSIRRVIDDADQLA